MYNNKGYEIGQNIRFHFAKPLSGYVEGEICSLEFSKPLDSDEIELTMISLASNDDNKLYVTASDISWAEMVEEGLRD